MKIVLGNALNLFLAVWLSLGAVLAGCPCAPATAGPAQQRTAARCGQTAAPDCCAVCQTQQPSLNAGERPTLPPATPILLNAPARPTMATRFAGRPPQRSVSPPGVLTAAPLRL